MLLEALYDSQPYLRLFRQDLSKAERRELRPRNDNNPKVN